jgi:hypothetical protein
MKMSLMFLSVIGAICIASLMQSCAPQNPPGVNSSYETLQSPVLKVYSVSDGEHNFVAYVVHWKEADVVVSDPLARSSYKVGDTIRFMVEKIQIEDPKGRVSSLSFTLTK